MPYIHENAGWPELKWDAKSLTEPLATVRHRQGLFVGRMSALGLDLRREAGLMTLTADVVKSSAIEGERLEPADVRSSIARRLGLEAGGLTATTRAVEGIVEVVLDATQRYAEPVTTERLHGWHAALFPSGHSGITPITVGAWRTDAAGPMQVVSGALGAERVHFEAPAAPRLPAEMARLLDWMNATAPLDPVLKAAIAHFWFVTIHPFDDGNGRIARAIADLALSRADRMSERFYSMSTQIESERAEYYRQLGSAQRGGLDITRWIEWFLACLGRAFDRAEQTLERVFRDASMWERANRSGLNDRQQAVFKRMLGDWEGYLTSSKYAKLARCSTDTALRDIRGLLEAGLLVRNSGGGRSVSYRLADPPRRN